MKIAFFHELHSGGARRASNEFARELRDRKNIVDLFFVDENISEKEKKFYDRVFYFPFHSKKIKQKDWQTRVYRDTIELIKLEDLHKKIAQTIDREKYDIVLVFP